MGVVARILDSPLFQHPLLKKYTALISEDLSATYSRDIQKWLLVAPIIGVITGLVIAGLTILILGKIWATLLPLYLAHHWMILPGLLLGFLLTGLIMQFRTPDPDEHSTEEIIRSYHDHQGDIDLQAVLVPKLLAAIDDGRIRAAAPRSKDRASTAAARSDHGCGREAATAYSGDPRDRRIMLISGAAAGMAAVFRAPLTGIVFALEMPYKDDLAHEALLPSLIASVVSYATLASFLGAEPVFGFPREHHVFKGSDLFWSALLGCGVGLIAMRFRHHVSPGARLSRTQPPCHTGEAAGWADSARRSAGCICLACFRGKLIPIGPNYEAVRKSC